MAALDRAALRMGTAELLTRADVPTGVVLAETVELASRFSTDGSGRFVNGLLARVAREVRGEGTPVELDPGEVEPDLAAPVDAPLQPLVEALIIDLDGVIRHWDEAYYPDAEVRLGLPAGSLAAVALEPDRLAPGHGRSTHLRGVVRRDRRRAGGGPRRRRRCGGRGLGVVDLADRPRRRRPRRGGRARSSRSPCSRTPPPASSTTSTAADLLAAFDAVVGSADIRAAKPAREAYEAAAAAAEASPERCLFVDDTMENVRGARALGMSAELFTEVEDLRALLRSQGLVR